MPMKNYYYKCFSCGARWSSDEIEENDHYLCPNCAAKNEPHSPLIGCLQVFYDYKEIKSLYTHDFFAKMKPGNTFQYPLLLPLKNEIPKIIQDRMILPVHNLYKISFDSYHALFVLDETHNPTYSYKDRASVLVIAKALELGRDTICTASTGNAASSMSGMCAIAGIKSKIIVPNSIPQEKLVQIQMYGAEVEKVDGSYDDAYDISMKKSQMHGWYNRNTAYNPLTTEGKKSGAFDIFLQLNCKAPDKVFVPTGDGSIISGIYKGFYDLKQLDLIKKIPTLIAVQAEGSSSIIDYFESNEFLYKESSTLADSISVNAPRNLYMAVDALKKTDGFGIKVSDDEILRAEKLLGQKNGYFVEPSAAAAWAGFIKYSKQSEAKGEKIVVLLTGSGLKDIKNAERALMMKEI